MTAENIKKIRKSLGLTQSGLADLLRLSPQSGARTIRDWENGRRPITGPASLALELILVLNNIKKE